MTIAWSVEYEPYYVGDDLRGWTAQIERGSAGALSVEPRPDGSLYISNIGVAARVLRQGVGTALFDRVVEENPQVVEYTSHVETPQGRVFLDAMQRRHPELRIRYQLTAGAELTPPP